MHAPPQIPALELDRLIADARGGCAMALNRLRESLSDALWAELGHRRKLRAMGPSHGLSDLIQDTLARVGEKFSLFDRGSFAEFKQWSRAILYRRRQQWTRNYLVRNDALRREQIGYVLRARVGRDGESVSDALQSRQEAERVHALFEALEPHEQFIIRLRVLEDRRFSEIAQLTGRSEDAARMAYRRAIRRLKHMYGSNGTT